MPVCTLEYTVLSAMLGTTDVTITKDGPTQLKWTTNCRRDKEKYQIPKYIFKHSLWSIAAAWMAVLALAGDSSTAACKNSGLLFYGNCSTVEWYFGYNCIIVIIRCINLDSLLTIIILRCHLKLEHVVKCN